MLLTVDLQGFSDFGVLINHTSLHIFNLDRTHTHMGREREIQRARF